jgi:hypothetical protein
MSPLQGSHQVNMVSTFIVQATSEVKVAKAHVHTFIKVDLQITVLHLEHVAKDTRVIWVMSRVGQSAATLSRIYGRPNYSADP